MNIDDLVGHILQSVNGLREIDLLNKVLQYETCLGKSSFSRWVTNCAPMASVIRNFTPRKHFDFD